LDDDGSLGALLALIEHAPASAEAEAALLLLYESLSEHLHRRVDIKRALEASGLLAENAEGTKEPRAARVVLAATIASRIDALDRDEAKMRARVARGGWLTSWRS